MLTQEELAEFKQLAERLEPARLQLLALEKLVQELSTEYNDVCRKVRRICDEHRPEYHKFFSDLEQPLRQSKPTVVQPQVESEEL